jgi:hypothetical protein
METLPLLSTDNKSELPCHVVAEVVIDGVRYVLVTPTHTWVSVVRDDEDGIVELETHELGPVHALFNSELQPHGLSLKVDSDEFLLVGELKEEFTEMCDTIGISEDEDDAYLILADVEHDGQSYLLLSPETPAMFAARVKDGKAHPLTESELAKVEDKLEAALVEQVH